MHEPSTAMDDDIADDVLQQALQAAVVPTAVKQDQPCLSWVVVYKVKCDICFEDRIL